MGAGADPATAVLGPQPPLTSASCLQPQLVLASGLRSELVPSAMLREKKERDAKEPDTMKEESGTDVSVRSRKRKANVAVVSTKETGGGGFPPSHHTWVLPTYLLIGGHGGMRLAEMVLT